MELGIYEALITQTLRSKLQNLDANRYFIIDKKQVDEKEATHFLANHLSKVISKALQLVKANDQETKLNKQFRISNNILLFLQKEIELYSFQEDLLEVEGKILEGIFDRLNEEHRDLNIRLAEIMPTSRLSQSELFTGGNQGISLESELRKEIRSSDRIDLLVSFIKWKAIVILKDAFVDFTSRGGKLRVITTTYMGASDAKAIEELSKLPNTEVKVSYNASNERLHAKAYLFYRNTGFHTAYIGSSNFSRSALTDGLEWNVKVTTAEIPHIIDKFTKTFESYWNSAEFELFDDSKLDKLSTALQANKIGKATDVVGRFFDLSPYHYQAEILDKLDVERVLHQSNKNLVVAATGTGKTMIAAFDFKRFKLENSNAKILFIAHRIEILKQALHTFRNVLKDQNFGELLGNGYQPTKKNAVFATIQSFNNLSLEEFCTPDYYDYIVLDEAHHGTANSYQKVIEYFKAQIMLGLTATPERMDGGNILKDFNHRIAAEIRLPDALNNKLLCPFQYFGISDSVDYTSVKWSNGKYDISELNRIYTANDIRVSEILSNLEKYTKDISDIRCIGFCASIEHAKFMHGKFQSIGLNSQYLVSENSSQREEIIQGFKTGNSNYLFVVDIFNEGVDIPEIDTVLFLRPTESLTIFLQQLGRGLRLHEGKDCLTVLDFVGHARDEYNYENKFRALIGKTNTTVLNELEKDFPHLPLGSSIVLEKKAKEYILENIKRSTSINKRALIQKIQNFALNFHAELNLSTFLQYYSLQLSHIYKNNTFTALYSEAFSKTYDQTEETNYKSFLSKKIYASSSLTYFEFILKLIKNGFNYTELEGSVVNNEQLALMLYYDFYGVAGYHENLNVAIQKIGINGDYKNELQSLLEYRIAHLSNQEYACTNLPFPFPLMVHGRYNREQILVAMGLSTYSKKSSNREGVAENKQIHAEALFINLKKSEEDFSPTTMYKDYAITDTLFHWQSQNQTAADSEKGKSYINQKQSGKTILLFVRESNKDAFGFTQGYVFLGPATYVSHVGSKPMSIQWKLEYALPNFMWKESAKLAVG